VTDAVDQLSPPGIVPTAPGDPVARHAIFMLANIGEIHRFLLRRSSGDIEFAR
jgi:hypothetical protein